MMARSFEARRNEANWRLTIFMLALVLAVLQHKLQCERRQRVHAVDDAEGAACKLEAATNELVHTVNAVLTLHVASRVRPLDTEVGTCTGRAAAAFAKYVEVATMLRALQARAV